MQYVLRAGARPVRAVGGSASGVQSAGVLDAQVRNTTMVDAILFTRDVSVAEVIEDQLQAAKKSIDAALYRLDSPRLARALETALLKGLNVRLVLDRNKYVSTAATRELLAGRHLSPRLSAGPQGRFRKMHHKFVILDGQVVLTGSYNWTIESEEQNYDNLLIIRHPSVVLPYVREFEELWASSEQWGEGRKPRQEDTESHANKRRIK